MTIEELQAENIDLREQLEGLKAVEADNAAKEQRIKDLQEHNQKLFLKITHEPEEPKTEPEPDTDLIAALCDKIKI
jgi:hypothetical protein